MIDQVIMPGSQRHRTIGPVFGQGTRLVQFMRFYMYFYNWGMGGRGGGISNTNGSQVLQAGDTGVSNPSG